jgi:hypothetical protein
MPPDGFTARLAEGFASAQPTGAIPFILPVCDPAEEKD